MRATFFDLDGTLLHYTREYDEVLRDTFIDVCGHCKQSWIEDYSNYFFRHFADSKPRPYRKAFQEVETDCSTRRLVNTLFRNEISMCEKPDSCDEILDYVSNNQVIGVLTNGVSYWQRQKLKEFGLSPYFDSTVVSYDIGVHKPEKEIFEYAESTVPATDFRMIGDSKEDDIEGALNAGWDSRIYHQDGFESLFNLE